MYLTAKNVHKRFGGSIALDGVSLALARGEIHALVGANGAGKSTLARIIAGHLKADKAEISIDDKPVLIRSPREAINLGVTMVTQQLSLAPHLTVAENIMLTELCRPGLWRPKAIYEQADAILSRLVPQGAVDLYKQAGALNTAHRQMVEIAKALAQNSQIIIFDEPTSALTPTEVERLFEIMRGLTAEGKGLAFVSHRLEEIFSITDRVTVLRDGVNICESVPTADLDQAELIRLMIGRDLGDVFHQRQKPVIAEEAGAEEPEGEVVLEVKNLSSPPLVKDVSFALHKGEILGLAGLVGAGRTQTARVLFGLSKLNGGSITVLGKAYNPKRPHDAYVRGLGMIPEDRKNQGIIPDFPVRENIKLSYMSIKAHILTGYNSLREKVLRITDRLKLPRTHLDKGILQLSGGQQQKALISRVLLMDPGILIVDEPTQGVDIGTRSDIYEILKDLADKGFSILFISSDFEEILGVCDRIVVLTEGRVAASVPARLLDEEKLTMFAAPRTSAEKTHRTLTDMTAQFPAAAAYWVYIDRGSVYCFNLSEGERVSGLGFEAGQVIPLGETCLDLFTASDEVQEFSSNDLFSLLVPIRNHRGQNMGYIGMSEPLASRSPGDAAKVSGMIRQLMN